MTRSLIAKPFGTWPSTITPELITTAAPGLSSVQSHNENVFWVESRAWEAGRSVILCQDKHGHIREMFPAPFSHNSKVHEYGGSAYTVADNHLYFVNANDQCIYRVALDQETEPEAISQQGPWRFADIIFDGAHRRLIMVCEEHRQQGEPENYLASLVIDGSDQVPTRLVDGADFYAYPRLSADQKTLCWIQWNHPQMPWDATQLWIANNQQLALTEHRLIAGQDCNEAIFQPQWSPDNQLYFVSDRNNWWNIYRFNEAGDESIYALDAEFATPLWQLGMSTYCFISESTIGCVWSQNGLWHSGLYDLNTKSMASVISEHSTFQSVCAHNGCMLMIADTPTQANRVISISHDLSTQINYAPTKLRVSKEEFSVPESFYFLSGNDEQVHAFYYSPINANFRGEDNELPPVIAMCHGGPTGSTDCGLNLKIQFWTSRGFAVVDINYRGSTGFGRDYRHSLTGCWGIKDVQDTTYAIDHLANQGKIDRQRCIIRGGSAGGYTVLSALTFTDTFKAGASLYGIGDLEMLARDTHKFEARYLDGLVGPYPQDKATYVARSPIHHASQLNCPVIFLQGLEDKVVPPNQAEMMVDILASKGIKVAHVTFTDEGHGFRKANNIIRALESELAFYRDVFHLTVEA
jgi:dipeptidyl aminopeptidase/acylaminoacyl peptidase